MKVVVKKPCPSGGPTLGFSGVPVAPGVCEHYEGAPLQGPWVLTGGYQASVGRGTQMQGD